MHTNKKRGITDIGFMGALQSGHLKPLIDLVRVDDDLDFQIRDNYINIYFKGNSLLKLDSNFKVTIDSSLTNGVKIAKQLSSIPEVYIFLNQVPSIKHQITLLTKKAIEGEYEQLFIRANNCDLTESEYFILDRQYTRSDGTESKLDLVGLYWSRNNRQKNKIVPLTIFEVKYSLNQDIKNVHEQLQRYHDFIGNCFDELVDEMETVLQQKTLLQTLTKKTKQDNDLSKLKILRDPKQVQFVLVLIDYNPNSTLQNLNLMKQLPFYNQVKIFRGGLGLWGQFLGRTE